MPVTSGVPKVAVYPSKWTPVKPSAGIRLHSIPDKVLTHLRKHARILLLSLQYQLEGT